jgi:hypothetical protein
VVTQSADDALALSVAVGVSELKPKLSPAIVTPTDGPVLALSDASTTEVDETTGASKVRNSVPAWPFRTTSSFTALILLLCAYWASKCDSIWQCTVVADVQELLAHAIRAPFDANSTVGVDAVPKFMPEIVMELL